MSEKILEPCPFCGGDAKTAGIADDNKVAFCDNVKCNLYQQGFPLVFWAKRTQLTTITAQLQSLITANNAYIQAVSKCGVNSSQEISASNQMKIATEAASRFIEGG